MTGKDRHVFAGFSAAILLATFLCGAWAVSAAGKEAWKVHDDLFSMSFPTDKEGWACGRSGVILHTSDGGATWERQASGVEFTLTSIDFTDRENGWAVGNKGTILHTADGGRTWKRQTSPIDYFHMCVAFRTPQKGFIASERTHILATQDGGETWQVRFKDEDFILKALSFCDDLHGWAVGEFGYIYATVDGGQSWQKQAGLYDLDEETGSLKGGTFLYDVVALDPRTAWAVGIQGAVKRTTDGGKTWEDVDLELPPVQLYCISWDGAEALRIGGRGLCVTSTDRGESWQEARFEPPIGYSWIYGLAPLSKGQGAACGDEGAIYLSGSPNWHRVGY
ncbi:MAG: YCF48-related protein [bacterium]